MIATVAQSAAAAAAAFARTPARLLAPFSFPARVRTHGARRLATSSRRSQPASLLQASQSSSQASQSSLSPQSHPQSSLPFSVTAAAGEASSPSNKEEPAVRVADSAVKRLLHLQQLDPTSGEFLRILVEGGGCHGYQYKIILDSTSRENDKEFGRDGARVVVDEDSLELLKGSMLIWDVSLMGSSFKIINNPNAKSGCGCHMSFDVN